MESSQLMSTLKRTHIDTHLDFNSPHDSQHKVITASTLLHKALYLPNCSEAKTPPKKRKRELNYVHAAVESNGYRSKFCYFRNTIISRILNNSLVYIFAAIRTLFPFCSFIYRTAVRACVIVFSIKFRPFM